MMLWNAVVNDDDTAKTIGRAVHHSTATQFWYCFITCNPHTTHIILDFYIYYFVTSVLDLFIPLTPRPPLLYLPLLPRFCFLTPHTRFFKLIFYFWDYNLITFPLNYSKLPQIPIPALLIRSFFFTKMWLSCAYVYVYLHIPEYNLYGSYNVTCMNVFSNWTTSPCASLWEAQLSHPQPFSVACSSLCMVEASVAFSLSSLACPLVSPLFTFGLSCWWDSKNGTSDMTRRHSLTENSLILSLFCHCCS